MRPASAPGTTFFLKYADAALVVLFSLIPLALHFPYRVNIFLSWEGAYRLYLGEVPWRDFGVPMGFGYWLLPAIFFKLFGPSLLTLVKAQVVLNLLAGFAFRGILKKMEVPAGVRWAAVLTFCLSYILINFWPWYNNTDIVYGLVGINMLLGAFRVEPGLISTAGVTGTKPANGGGAPVMPRLLGAAFFLFLSFFTKQDGGFLLFAVAAVLAIYEGLTGKGWTRPVIFFCLYILMAMAVILPFTRYSFSYWFNHGQPPHTARLSPGDILSEFLEASQWIKFYLLLIVLVVAAKVQGTGWKAFTSNRKEMVFLWVTIGILGTASIFQVTSYTPPDNNIFFHAFAIAYILTGLSDLLRWDASAPGRLAILSAVVLLWWSGSYWKYIDRIVARAVPAPGAQAKSSTGENVINRHTYMINTDTAHMEDEGTWEAVPDMPAFKKVYLPPSTVEGIQRLRRMPVFADTATSRPHVLNMSELTPLALELHFREDKGPMEPLWYHLGVGMFNLEADTVCARIGRQSYDAVLFEYVPSLNNFYPFRVRDTLMKDYRLVDSFLAPRRPTNGYIEVWVPAPSR